MKKLFFSSDFITPISIFVGSRLLLFLIFFWAPYFPISQSYPDKIAVSQQWVNTPIRWLDVWGRWDTGWYLDIAQYGYENKQTTSEVGLVEESRWAFFPLYPLTIYMVKEVLFFLPDTRQSFFVIAVIISQLGNLLAILSLYRFVKMIWSSRVASFSIWIMSIFPTSFFFSAAYSESIFLLFSILTLYFAWKENWRWTGVLGSLSVLTRSNGLLIFLPVIWMWYYRQKKNLPVAKSGWWLALIPFSFLMFLFFAYIKTDNFFAPFLAQQAWHRGLQWPWTTWFGSVGWVGYLTPIDKVIALSSLLSIGIQLLFEQNLKRKAFWVYGLVAIVFLLMTGSLISLSRLLLGIVPLFISIAVWIERYPKTEKAVLLCLAVLQVFYFLGWVRLYWVG